MILRNDTKIYIVMRKAPDEYERWGEVRTTDNGARDYLSEFSHLMSDKVQWSVTLFEGKEIFDRSIILNRHILKQPRTVKLSEILSDGRPNTILG